MIIVAVVAITYRAQTGAFRQTAGSKRKDDADTCIDMSAIVRVIVKTTDWTVLVMAYMLVYVGLSYRITLRQDQTLLRIIKVARLVNIN